MLNFFKTKTFKVGSLVVALSLALVMVASASTTYMSINAGGVENVKAIQTLVGATADGKVGPKTLAAIATWQGLNGLTADGKFGPMSAAKANMVGTGTGTGGVGALCPNGNTLASNCATAPAGTGTGALCPNGNLLSNNCAAGTGSTTGAEGSATVTFDGVPGDSLAVNKGESKAVIGFKVKATGSDMNVTRLWLDVNARIWLYADTITLMDGSTVLGTYPLSASTVEEVTAGSAYTIKMAGFNFMVPVGTTKVLTVKISRPTLTTSSGNVTIAATSTLRAVDGAGISDTYWVGSSTRTLNLPNTTAATGTMTNTLSATAPLAQSVSGLSTTAGVTTAVKLMDFDLKATSGAVNVTAITGTLNTASGATCSVTQCVASVELRDGSTVLSSVTGATTLSFSSLNIDVADGATKTLSLYGIMNHVASSYVVAGDGIVAAITATTGTSGASYTAANTSNTVTGNTQYLYQYAPTFALVNTSQYPTSATQVDESTSTTTTKSADYKLSFSVTAPAGSDVYIDAGSTIQVQAYTASPTVPGASKLDTTYGGTLTTSYQVSGATSVGSVATTYDKVAAGQTRYFTVTGYIPHGGTAGDAGMRIAAIKWTTTDAVTGSQVQTWGISDLKTGKARVTLN